MAVVRDLPVLNTFNKFFLRRAPPRLGLPPLPLTPPFVLFESSQARSFSVFYMTRALPLSPAHSTFPSPQQINYPQRLRSLDRLSNQSTLFLISFLFLFPPPEVSFFPKAAEGPYSDPSYAEFPFLLLFISASSLDEPPSQTGTFRQQTWRRIRISLPPAFFRFLMNLIVGFCSPSAPPRDELKTLNRPS